MTGTRAALLMGAIPVFVALLYLGLQVASGDPVQLFPSDGDFFSAAGDFIAGVAGTIDPAGVILLLALGISMGFGFVVILRGARDL
ncbi:MAG: hypothetical protein AB1Z67_02810 [Candidatus Limnocylindrales bacterium]